MPPTKKPSEHTYRKLKNIAAKSALKAAAGNKSKAARLLGICRNTLKKWLVFIDMVKN